MEYISSDTNVWIDFSIIHQLGLPFILPFTFIMNADAIEDELLSPAGLKDDLIRYGLEGVEMDIEEFELAEEFSSRYLKLSVYDITALAIAKRRNITLLTGDRALRKAAQAEGVEIIGTIGILDLLYEKKLIKSSEYKHCLKELQSYNGSKIRLPKEELALRLQSL
jgi:predicted nucleic acid-binding protein